MPEEKLNTENTLDLHTEGIRDIITKVPSLLIRWGITVFFFVLLLIITLSATIRYPDILTTQIKIIFDDKPQIVKPNIQGKLYKVFAKENTTVIKGQLLASVGTGADAVAVIKASAYFASLKTQLTTQRFVQPDFSAFTGPEFGELQSQFDSFASQFQGAQSKEVRMKLLDSLISRTKRWNEQHLIFAPKQGRLIYMTPILEHNLYYANDNIFYIIPDNQAPLGRILIKNADIAKVKKGQTVLVNFKNFGYDKEFSMFGKINFISLIPENGFYTLEVFFSDYGKQAKKIPLILNDGMVCNAEIITRDVTVFDRMTKRILSVNK